MKKRITALLLTGCVACASLCMPAGAVVTASYNKTSSSVTVSHVADGALIAILSADKSNVIALGKMGTVNTLVSTGALKAGDYAIVVYGADGSVKDTGTFTVTDSSGGGDAGDDDDDNNSGGGGSGGGGGGGGGSSSGGSGSKNSSKDNTTTPTTPTTPPATAVSFTDTVNHWASSAIQFVVERGLFKGTSATTFSPEMPMTRAMLATVLYRYAGEPAVQAASAFTDVPAGQYYTNPVAWASEKGVVMGIGNGKFDPNGNIIRQDLAVMLYRYAGSPAVTGEITGFADTADISDYAKDAMLWATQKGILAGDQNKKLNPHANATRAEVATMIMRFASLNTETAQ